MISETIVVGALQVNCYVLGDEQSREAVVIDPGDNAPAILAAVERHQLRVSAILATHAHFDHLMATRPLAEAVQAPLYMHAAEQPILDALRETALAWFGVDPGPSPALGGTLNAGDIVRFGDEALEVRATPGHSPGGISLVHHQARCVFTGDALFAGSIGRTDLQAGDTRALLQSIHTQIMSLPDDYVILPGHGPASSVGKERRTNPFLAPEAFDWL